MARPALALAVLISLAGCVPASAPPPPAAVQAPPPPPPPAPPSPPPAPVAWADAPLTPGNWSHGNGIARYGVAGQAAALTITCDQASRQISLTRLAPGTAAVRGAIDVTTSFGKRRLPAAADGAGGLAARLTSADGLLDWMAFSRGRIRLEATGQSVLTLPSWPEIGRVVEDCRK